mgnify:FL=1
MLPRIQRSSCDLLADVHPTASAGTRDCDIVARLADSMLGSAAGMTRCVIAHFARTRRAHSLNAFAEQLVRLLQQPVDVQVTGASIRLHSNWEVPFIALKHDEIKMIAILIARTTTFNKRNHFVARLFAYNDVMQERVKYAAAIDCVIAFVATLPCGYLAAPLAALCAKHTNEQHDV